jgi:hypothetical protein
MIPHFYVLGFGMEHWVLGNAYGTGAITLKWDMGIVDAKSAPSAKHTASRTSWLHTREESRDVPVNFS